jgi:hypothetical protein
VRKSTPDRVSVVENEFAALWFYPHTRILHSRIHKFMPGTTYQDLLQAGLNYLEKHKASKWLSDNRRSPVVSQDDVRWRSGVWAPRALRAGFKYWAVVMPDKPIGKMQVRLLIEEFGQMGVAVQAFPDVDAAMRWLESADGDGAASPPTR